MNGVDVILSSTPVSIIAGWHAVWTLRKYTDQKTYRSVETALVYRDGKVYPDIDTAIEPNSELLLPIKLMVASGGVIRSAAKYAKHQEYWGLIRMDDAMYVLPNQAKPEGRSRAVGEYFQWGDAMLPASVTGWFNFEWWVKQVRSNPIDVSKCPKLPIVDVIGEESYQSLHSQFRLKIKKLMGLTEKE